jgi:hypothetical protein
MVVGNEGNNMIHRTRGMFVAWSYAGWVMRLLNCEWLDWYIWFWWDGFGSEDVWRSACKGTAMKSSVYVG